MKRIEEIYREILHQVLEKKNNTLTQRETSIKLDVSISTVKEVVLDIKKSSRKLKWKPTTELQIGITNHYEWMKKEKI